MNTILNFMKNKKIRNWTIVAIAALIVLGFAFFSPKKSSAQADNTATVVSLEVAETIEASGSLAAQPFASLTWKSGGVVENVNVEPGDFVKDGDVLLSLQPSSTSASIVNAQSDLLKAQEDLENLLKSDTERAQAAIDLDDAQEAYDKARDWRVSLNGEIWITRITYKTIGGRQVPTEHSYRDYADPETIAEADRDLALKMSQLEDAQRAYDRLKDGPNPDDVAAAQAKVDAAQATVNSLHIIAPFDGQVLSVEHRAGDTVTNGELSVNLADLNQLYIETQVDESDVANLKLGNQAEVTLDAMPGVTLTGEVSIINPVGEIVSGLVKYKVRVDLDKIEEGTFLPLGTTANVVIKVKDEAAVLAVPITAIQNDSKGEYVWVMRNDTATRVDVIGGSIVGELVAVTGDLTEGETLQIVNESSFNAPNPFGGNK
ncbi:MAG: efflux RND transporter periplasmic adaptor subunit [Chloroflexi bacterium]|nr:efflux RND transporter periplasmic adaptor subunit [Chloroflexota bacterium]